MKIGVEDRLEKRKIIQPSGCWTMLGWKGRPQILIDGKLVLVTHAIMWLTKKISNYDIKELILHKCNNDKCWNPEHLYIGNHKDNHIDKVLAGKHKGPYTNATHCIHGHEFTIRNTYIRPNGNRSCRECLKLRARKYHRKR